MSPTITKGKSSSQAVKTAAPSTIKPKRRVMICCVTFETVKVVKPIADIGAERVHIIHTSSDDTEGPKVVYKEFYDEVFRQLVGMGIKEDQIIEENIPVFRFKEVLGQIVEIMTRERKDGNDVYINVSAGSSEYAAAATIAAMMVEGVQAFTVHTREYSISTEKEIRSAYFSKGKPVGQSKKVAEPVVLPTFPIDMPSRELVVALRIFKEKKDAGKSTTYNAMIEALEAAGIWDYKPDGKKNEEQAKKMYYSRHFIDGWIKLGWITGKSGRGRDIEITESGKNVTDIFYME